MERMSRPLRNMRDHYSVVVVGSGYGGGIAASRLSRADLDVCVLERGREIHPGEFPNTLLQAADEMQAHTPGGHLGRSTAMFDVRIGDDISVVVGCGLGGTSLINANVALRADPWVFKDRRTQWPKELRDNGRQVLDPFYDRAASMLGTTTFPQDRPQPAKFVALQRSAKALGVKAEIAPVNVTFEDGLNAAGVRQAGCTMCGDCVSGCNYGAKNTVLMNYLPDAHRHGAEIFTEIEVRFVRRRDDGRWLVAFDVLGTGDERFGPPTSFITADTVVLAAGAIGSTEILLRSHAAGLSASDLLGHGFSGNGDFLAFAYDGREPVHAIGLGSRSPGDQIGPCITGMIPLTRKAKGKDESRDKHLLIEDGVIPGALGLILPAAFRLAAEVIGEEPRLPSKLAHAFRAGMATAAGAYAGPIDKTLTYLVIGEDDEKGRVLLENDEATISWPGVADRPVFRQDSDRLERAAAALGATYIPNPVWRLPFHRSLVTVHPLGGCGMGDDATTGVVNHKGQVFAGERGTDVHEGLYVMDGAVIPMPIAVNPLLTISAIAERACQLMADDHDWTIDLDGGGS
jgi:cholesterol oxidase